MPPTIRQGLFAFSLTLFLYSKFLEHPQVSHCDLCFTAFNYEKQTSEDNCKQLRKMNVLQTD